MNGTILQGQEIRVKEERKRLELTQQEAADKCGISRSQWMRYERGETLLEGAALRAFTALGADPQYIISGKRSSEDEATRWVTAVKITESRKAKLQSLIAVLEKLSEDDLDIIAGLASRMQPRN